MLLGLLFFIIYGLSATAVPTGIADADELTLTSHFLSVPHPPGFGLFSLVGYVGLKFFGLFAQPAHAANLLSGLFQAIAVYLFYLISLELQPQKKLAAAATCLFGFSYFIWNYATIYEITSFTALLTTATLLSAVKWYRQKKPSTRLFLLTWILSGLLLAHYHLAIVLFPAFLWLILSKKTVGLKPFLAGLFTLIISTVITSASLFLLNAGSDFSWDFVKTPAGWWHHLSRQDYVGIELETATAYRAAFALPNLFDQPSFQSIIDFFSTLVGHFNPLTVLIVILGGLYLWQKHRPYFWFYLLLFVFSGPVLAAYMETAGFAFEKNLLTGIAERQYVLSQIAAGLFILPGLSLLSSFLRPKLTTIVLIGLILYQIFNNSYLLLKPQSRSFNYTNLKQKLEAVAADSLIICTTDIDCYTLWYLSLIDGIRPDVQVLASATVYRTNFLKHNPDLYPFSQINNPYYLTFLVAHNQPRRPIYFTSGLGFYDQYLGLENGPFFLIPSAGMFRLTTTFPESLEFSPLSTVIPPLHPNERYQRGIVEAEANNLAYAGYLGLKYNQPDMAAQYLLAASQLDPDSSQTRELITNQAAIIDSIRITNPQLTPDKLINQPEADDQSYRYAFLLSGNQPAIISAAKNYFSSISDVTMAHYLSELLIYNSQVPE